MSFSIKRFASIFNARNKEYYRDKGALGWSVIFPILIIVSFGYLFNLDENELYKAGVVQKTKNIDLDIFQVIPVQDFDSALIKLRHHSLDIVIDQSQDGILNYWIHRGSPKSSIAERLLQSEAWRAQGLKLNPNIVEGETTSYVEWLFPGLLAMNVMWMALWGVGWVIVRQRKTGVLKRFKASPLTAFEYLLAQMISRMLILAITGVLIFALGHLIYPFKTVGSYFDLFFIYILGCFALSAMGLIISARMTSDELASGLLNMISFPMMFLSEIWFSLEGSSPWVQNLAKAMPLWHITDGMRKIMHEGLGLADLQFSVMILIGMSISCLSVGALSFKWTSH